MQAGEIAAVVEERRRLAGELHDCVGGTLSGVALGLSALQRTIGDDRSREKIADLAQAVRRGLQEIRTFSFSLQLPWCETENSFEAAVAKFATGFGRRVGLKVSLDITPQGGSLANDEALVLLRVLQEALLNVHRHAKASIVRVSFRRDRQMATLVIEDDGCGMDFVQGEPPAGAGLQSMRDHIGRAGGVVRVESAGAGTTVSASLPIRDDKDTAEVARRQRDVQLDLKERSHSFMFVLSGPDLRYEFANSTYLRLIGEQDVVGRRLLDVLPDIEPEYPAIVAQVRETGETFVGHGMRRVLRTDGVMRTLYIDLVAHPLFADDGSVEAVFLEGYDVTAKVEAEQQLKLVMRELDHRADNLLAVVQSIVNLSKGASPDSLRRNILGRIRALAQSHELLSKADWRGADLRQLVEQELRPYTLGEPGRIRICGPAIQLTSREAHALAMAFHELATNAAKYGALSAAGGRVEVTWKVTGRGARLISWQEDGGPRVDPPSRRGFGSSVLERTLKGRIGGRTQLLWRAEGLVCVFELPPGQPDQPPASPLLAEPNC